MKFKFWQTEKRDSGGSYSDAVLRLIEQQAAGTAASTTSTAAVEAASGLLARSFASARVDAPEWAVSAVSGEFLSQVGRDLVRRGQSMHVIRVNSAGMVRLIPASSWHFEGSDDPDTWRVRVSTSGPSTSVTRNIPYTGVVFIRWGSEASTPYTGVSPMSWASSTARLQSEVERALGDEASGPVAQLIPYPRNPDTTDDEDGNDDRLLADIRAGKGRALLVETMASGQGEGRGSAPQKDWVPNRLGPMPPEALVNLRGDAFTSVLAACGVPPSLFLDSDGTAQREGIRRFHQNVTLSYARILQDELTSKLETDVKLTFDGYALDLQGRASAFQRLVAGGVGVNEALATSGLLADA